MMKKNYMLTLFALLAGSFLSNAQMVIDLSNHPAPATDKDTLVALSNVGLKIPTTGANQIWNYGRVKDSILLGGSWFTYTKWQPNMNSSFSDASRSILVGNQLFDQIGYYDYFYETDNSQADAYSGLAIVSRQSYTLGAITGNSKDSIVFPIQTDIYATPDILLKYPATENSNWSSHLRTVINFDITIISKGLNMAPCMKIVNHNRTDSVVGWGVLSVPYGKSGQSTYDSVIEVKESIRDIDSFYLNGKPASDSLLRLFGLKNDSLAYANRYIFYRAGHNEPLFEVFLDLGWQKTQLAAYDKQFNVLMGIDIQGMESFTSSAYPNPVMNGNLNLQFDKTSPGVWTISVSNTMGKIVSTREIAKSEGNTSVQVTIPPSAANGIYIYSIRAENGSVSEGKFLLNR